MDSRGRGAGRLTGDPGRQRGVRHRQRTVKKVFLSRIAAHGSGYVFHMRIVDATTPQGPEPEPEPMPMPLPVPMPMPPVPNPVPTPPMPEPPIPPAPDPIV